MSGKWLRERKRGGSVLDGEEVAPPLRLVRPLGQGEALARWVRQARRLRLPHGVVVEGAKGVGKTTIVQWLTAALLCPSELDEHEPCGVCRTCTRIANELHPDVHVLRRPRNDAEHIRKVSSFHRVTVHQVRAVEQELHRSAVEGRARVCAIVEADRLEDEGQNALLKTLEEPGEATFLLLEAARPEHLLPTVRSRVQRLRVMPLSNTELQAQLWQRIPQHSGRFDDLAGLARGSLGTALELATEQTVQLHDLVRQWLAGGYRLRPVATAKAALAGVAERRDEVDRARSFLSLLRGEMRRQRDLLASAAAGSYPAAALEPWTAWLERTLEAERDLDLMIPPLQVLTACLLQLVG